MNYRFLCVVCCLLFVADKTFAQDSLITNYESSISFPTDIDSIKVDSFFKKHTIDLTKCDKPELYYEIYRWYHTCYRYGGSTSKGIDCSHFINMLYEKMYGGKLNSSAAAIFAQCKVVKGGIEEAAEGDLLFFKIKKKRVSHIAIYLQHGKFAHASTQAGIIISDITDPYYKRHFFKVGRVE